ncbi:MAG: hypothetical protein ACI89R_001166 [Candidatus Azotimanducaceae bacterium]|jgi:hypothetical protein
MNSDKEFIIDDLNKGLITIKPINYEPLIHVSAWNTKTIQNLQIVFQNQFLNVQTI